MCSLGDLKAGVQALPANLGQLVVELSRYSEYIFHDPQKAYSKYLTNTQTVFQRDDFWLGRKFLALAAKPRYHERNKAQLHASATWLAVEWALEGIKRSLPSPLSGALFPVQMHESFIRLS